MGKKKMSNFEETGINCELEVNTWDKAPLSKKKLTYTFKTLYKYYEHKKTSSGEKPFSKDVYVTFLKEYFKLVMMRVVQEGFIFILPYYLGRFYLKKSSRVGFVPVPDAKEGELKRKRTANFHSFRKFFNVKWDKETALFKNRTIWRIEIDNEIRQAIKNEVLNNDKPVIDRPLIGHAFHETKYN